MNAQLRLFLDVKKSANGVAWRHRLRPQDDNIALAMAQTYGVSDIVARVLAGRGVQFTETKGFLDPTIRDLLPDPVSLTDMEVAADRLAKAIINKEQVAIFGDYDVDGASSSALISRFLAHFGVKHAIHIPDRIFEGYGPNPDAMRKLAEDGATLIVTVDCGTNSAAALQAAKDSGADVVVLDHHQVGGDLPEAALAVVNPNREDDLSGQGHLCAAGVVFLALVATARILKESRFSTPPPDLLSFLDLVALATVCDVVPLTGVNRAFVVKGLQVARKLDNPGLAALARVARIGEPVSPYHFGFIIGPRINAGGRIGDAALGSRLLSTTDPADADKIAAQLDQLNQERQAMEQVMLADARAQAEAELSAGDGPAVLIAESDQWHPGIVGLLASRLKDFARRPAIAISFNAQGVGTGSGRSIPGFDLGGLVRAALDAGLLTKGGGHTMAAGITIERSKLGALRAFLEERAGTDVFALRESDSLKIDAALSAESVTNAMIDELEHAGPFGAGHSRPIFALPRHTITNIREVGSGGHLRVSLRSQAGGRMDAMAFRAAETDLGRFLGTSRGQAVHLAGTVSSRYWNGQRQAQFQILDAAEIS